VAMHRVTGQRLQGQGGDEFMGRAGHHYTHLGAGVLQPTHQFGTFIGSDPAADSEYHLLVQQPLHHRLQHAWQMALTIPYGDHSTRGRCAARPVSRRVPIIPFLPARKGKYVPAWLQGAHVMPITDWPAAERPREKLL